MLQRINILKNRVAFRLKAFGKIPRRLYNELDYINENGGIQALLLLSDLVRYLNSEGIQLGAGYGFATNSLICYGIGLTDVNPSKWKLPFEHFTFSFKPNSTFWIETSKGGFAQAGAFLESYCDYPISVDAENEQLYKIVLLEDPQFPDLKIGFIENPALDILKSLVPEMRIGPATIKLDERTLEFFREGDTADIPGFSNSDLREALIKFEPECFSDICLIGALYHSDLKDMIPEITRRKIEHDIPSTGNAEKDSILMESYGEMVYREQAFKIGEDNINDAKMKKLLPRGHAIARTMLAVQLAYYKSKMPSAYHEAYKRELIRMSDNYYSEIKD